MIKKVSQSQISGLMENYSNKKLYICATLRIVTDYES